MKYIGKWKEVSDYQYILLQQFVDEIPNTKLSNNFTFIFDDNGDILHLFTKKMFESSKFILEIER